MAFSPRTAPVFFTVWFGQFVSLVGTGLTSFGLAAWVFLETGSAAQLGFILAASAVPQLMMVPFAGALVDRWDRRLAMLVSDTGAAAGTLAIAVLVAGDSLEIWHLYPILAITGIFQSLQWPAYSAASTLLVPSEDYGRAAGLVQLADAAGTIVSPAAGGFLLAAAGLEWVLAVDIATFLVALLTLSVVRFPRPVRSQAGREGSGRFLSEAAYGLRYVHRRRGLLALLIYFSLVNVAFSFTWVLLFPVVLGFASEAALGTAISIAGFGGIAGGILMTVWGGGERKMPALLLSIATTGLGMSIVGLRPSLPLIVAGLFIVMVSVPVASGSSQAIWQSKVDPDVQGRVFSVRRLLSGAASPLAFFTAGGLVTLVQPWFESDGALAGSVGELIGTGPGRGAAFIIVVFGLLAVLVTGAARRHRPLWRVEDDLPDAVASDADPSSGSDLTT